MFLIFPPSTDPSSWSGRSSTLGQTKPPTRQQPLPTLYTRSISSSHCKLARRLTVCLVQQVLLSWQHHCLQASRDPGLVRWRPGVQTTASQTAFARQLQRLCRQGRQQNSMLKSQWISHSPQEPSVLQSQAAGETGLGQHL